MTARNYLEERIHDLLETARFAPSAHNTQPWTVSIGENSIHITPVNNLAEGDPTGRQTVVGLGIFTEALCIACRASGLVIKEVVNAGNAATINLSGTVTKPQGEEYVKLLRQRCSDRSIYTPVSIPQELARQLKTDSGNATIRLVTDKKIINAVANLTSKGIRLALSSPHFRDELRQYLVMPWSSKKRGIAVKSLYIRWILEMLQPVLLRFGLGINAEAKLEKRRWESASGIVVITTNGDMPPDWLEAGRAYMRAGLTIEKAGLSQATSAAIVEASDFHEDIEKLLGTTERIQAIIRIGRGSRKRYYSPRITPEEILVTSN